MMRLLSLFIFPALLAMSTFGQRTEFCTAFSESNHTTGTIRVKALMSYSTVTRIHGGESFLYSPGCNNPDYFARTVLSRLKKPAKIDRFFDSLPAEKNYIFELDVSGRLVTSIIPVFGDMGWARSQFEIDEIHSIANVSARRGFVKPDQEAEGKITNTGNRLRDINADIMMLFLESSGLSETERLLDERFVVIGTDGVSYGKSNFRDLNRLRMFGDTKGYPASFVTAPDRVEKSGVNYVVSGVMGIMASGMDGPKKQVRYENTYRITDDDIVLVKSRLTRL